MDFIVGLPKATGYASILVNVDSIGSVCLIRLSTAIRPLITLSLKLPHSEQSMRGILQLSSNLNFPLL